MAATGFGETTHYEDVPPKIHVRKVWKSGNKAVREGALNGVDIVIFHMRWNTIINSYNESVSDKTKEFAEKEISLEFDPISESAFNKLMNSNDWNFAQTVELADIICE